MWVADDGLDAGTALGRDTDMTCRGGVGSALVVAYLCDHKIVFGEWRARG